MIFGFPSWIIGVTVVFAILFWWTLEFAVRLRYRLKPKFSVSYDNESWSFRKPIRLTSDVGKTFERGISIRAQIQCESGTAIEQCSGVLTKIEYKPVGGDFSEIPIYEPNKLPWALEEPIEFKPVSVFLGCLNISVFVYLKRRRIAFISEPMCGHTWPHAN